ncbi:MAG: hypothetical protein JNK38_15180 [Acidobacteria bacterium]|nr:hypothetical protein [Acidobacteriota bacterium]
MITQLDMELQEARKECEEVMDALRYSGLTRWLAADERNAFLGRLNYLLNTLDEIENLVLDARNLIRESVAIRAMLFHSGLRVCSPKLIQTMSNESAIAEELLLIQEQTSEKVTRIGRLMRRYNDYLRELVEMRVAGSGRMWMSLGGIPSAEYFPLSLNVHLLGELYEEGHAIRRPPDPIGGNWQLSGGNGNGRNSKLR